MEAPEKIYISNENTTGMKKFARIVFIAAISVFYIMVGVSLELSDALGVVEFLVIVGITIIILLPFYHFLFGRFYDITTDGKWVYFKRGSDKGQFEVSRLVDISGGLPYKLLNERAYSMRITFLLPNGEKKKISFLSCPVKFLQNIFNIDLYEELRIIANNNCVAHGLKKF